MEIALIGYGKMGKAIEAIALERGHRIVLKINKENINAFSESNLQLADVAIEFTEPQTALEHVNKCLKAGVPVISGTTGWNHQLAQAKEKCLSQNGAFLHASNFSIGVNLFFEINKQLAALMNDWPSYQVAITETHHTEKKDAPSGTAITLAEQVLSNCKRVKHWQSVNNGEETTEGILPIISERIDSVPGTHEVVYNSEIDEISIKHTAHNRKGFALGAVLAAEFIKGKKGVFTMSDVLSSANNIY